MTRFTPGGQFTSLARPTPPASSDAGAFSPYRWTLTGFWRRQVVRYLPLPYRPLPHGLRWTAPAMQAVGVFHSGGAV